VYADCNLPVSWRTAPRSFPALMGLYESNYLRLARLAGNLAALVGTRVSTVPGDCDLLLTVRERAPYTSELQLTYLLPALEKTATAPERIPDLRLRVYHDARLLAVHDAAPVAADRELDRRWARNLLLNKWLDYCAERGHRFAPAQSL
jgi:uncharacterized protein YqiB (DUF1249 family)